MAPTLPSGALLHAVTNGTKGKTMKTIRTPSGIHARETKLDFRDFAHQRWSLA
jgi:hypothetical protein